MIFYRRKRRQMKGFLFVPPLSRDFGVRWLDIAFLFAATTKLFIGGCIIRVIRG